MTATETLLAADTELAGLGPTPFALPLGPLAPVVAGASARRCRLRARDPQVGPTINFATNPVKLTVF